MPIFYQAIIFIISCSYTYSSFTNILHVQFRLIHSPIFYPSKIFPCMILCVMTALIRLWELQHYKLSNISISCIGIQIFRKYSDLQQQKLVNDYIMFNCSCLLIYSYLRMHSCLSHIDPIKGAGTTVSFNFLHLTMQEFLAARYISHCPVEQQKDLLRHSFMHCELGANKFINPGTPNNSFAWMWQMYIGLVGVDCDAWNNLQLNVNSQWTKCFH